MKAELSKDFSDWLVKLRRWFHQFPELAYQEKKTAEKICQVLETYQIPFQSGVGGTGVVARVKGKNPGPVVAFRADMDALPLVEGNDVPYKSRHTGLMHACGHDGHMTIALGLIRWLVESKWSKKGFGEILFIFQPGEEGGAGAKAMLDTGIFDKEPIRAVFAGHMHPEHPTGHIGIAAEISNAAADPLFIRLKGKGGHGAHPHQCRDPIVVGAHIITQLQTLISRELPPLENAVLSICRFQAGTAINIIPEEAVLEGTIRTLRSDIREQIHKRIKELVVGVAQSYNVSAIVKIEEGYPLLVNDPGLVTHTVKCAKDLLGNERVHMNPPRMGSEDFSYFCQKWGGIMVGLGCQDATRGQQYGLHSCYFDFDENVLDLGVRLFGNVLTQFIENQMR